MNTEIYRPCDLSEVILIGYFMIIKLLSKNLGTLIRFTKLSVFVLYNFYMVRNFSVIVQSFFNRFFCSKILLFDLVGPGLK